MLEVSWAESEYPQLFSALRAVGWWEGRQVEPPAEELAPCLVANDYADEFLRSFSGLSLWRRKVEPNGIAFSYGMNLGFDEKLMRMDPCATADAICKLAGSSFVYPIFDAGTGVAFALEDGKTLFIADTFQGYAWTEDPFAMMDWLYFDVPRPGLALIYLPKDHRPPDFYDFD
ncbi:MAG TPA: hypothetical protein VFQ61_15870 [Polyangiaceae bacterium]|nr:hypothetical protein [Polyangiaceae bacterium]